MLKKSYILAVLLLLILATGCSYLSPVSKEEAISGEVIQIGLDENNNTVTIVDDEIKTDEDMNESKEKETVGEESYTESTIKIEKVEGDLVILTPDAYDPDGDVVQYTFSEPFNSKGEWQTKEGDAGNYEINVVASDGKLSTTETVLVILKPTNKAPKIDCPAVLKFKETETVNLDECEITDPEGDELVMMYGGWLGASTKETDFGDAGTYQAKIIANDGHRRIEQAITIEIEKLNRAPKIDDLNDIYVEEEAAVDVALDATDADGDKLTFEYGEPLDSDGKWTPAFGETGTFETYVIVSDGESSVKKKFNIVVKQKNTAPTLTEIDSINVEEGETISIPVEAVDREGDEITITISGWLQTAEYTTTYSDAGQHTVTVTASDGELSTSQVVSITVEDNNRAPVFRIPA